LDLWRQHVSAPISKPSSGLTQFPNQNRDFHFPVSGTNNTADAQTYEMSVTLATLNTGLQFLSVSLFLECTTATMAAT
jgi:hypothetical protein